MPGTAPSLSQSPSIPGRGRVPGRRSARSPSADPLRPRPPIRSRHHHEARLEEVVVIRRDRQRWLSRPTSPAGDPHRPGRCYVHCAASTRPTTTHPCTILESQFLSATFSKVRNLRRVRTRKDIFSWCKGASIGWHSDDNKPNLRHRAFTWEDKLWLLLSNLEDWKKQLRKLLDVTMVTDSHGPSPHRIRRWTCPTNHQPRSTPIRRLLRLRLVHYRPRSTQLRRNIVSQRRQNKYSVRNKKKFTRPVMAYTICSISRWWVWNGEHIKCKSISPYKL
ncbi:uncharacterized protein LOC120641948 isoform X7 [Panicum virgatum]|uniref:uncharacterized protein LOC120641948 isoform X7 n=1 Tax=Panicum virgatum TaxID=38727 RepID=UPI0019D57E5E|nr:uncharacterized protein LOC120641948 isoform X7 [Panicum virgatum]